MADNELVMTDSELAQLMDDLADCLGADLTNELMYGASVPQPTNTDERESFYFASFVSTVVFKCHELLCSKTLSCINSVAVRRS